MRLNHCEYHINFLTWMFSHFKAQHDRAANRDWILMLTMGGEME